MTEFHVSLFYDECSLVCSLAVLADEDLELTWLYHLLEVVVEELEVCSVDLKAYSLALTWCKSDLLEALELLDGSYSATDEVLAYGRNTREAIEQGVMQGILHEIEGYVERISAENNKKSIIFCGGDAESFVNRIKNAIFAPRKLMFTGLNRILEYNVSKNNI